MELIKTATAGTLESSDLMVTAAPGEQGLEVEIASTVLKQFGPAIRRAAREVAQELGVENAKIQIDDHGALDCTVRARVETALLRASGEVEA